MMDTALEVVPSSFVLYLFTFVKVLGILLSGMIGKNGKISDDNLIHFNKYLFFKKGQF